MIEINGIKASIKNGYSLSPKVILTDDSNTLSPEEAEKIIRYLFVEGFIDTEDVFLEVIKKQ